MLDPRLDPPLGGSRDTLFVFEALWAVFGIWYIAGSGMLSLCGFPEPGRPDSSKLVGVPRPAP